MKEIKFTSDHIQKIKLGEKTSTLRTLKKPNLYREDSIVNIHGVNYKIHIKKRILIRLTKSGIYHYDLNEKANREKIVSTEGFDSWNDLISWFENKNYNIPQPMFLYIFEKPDNVDSDLTDYQ